MAGRNSGGDGGRRDGNGGAMVEVWWEEQKLGACCPLNENAVISFRLIKPRFETPFKTLS